MRKLKISEIEWKKGNVYRDNEKGYLWKVSGRERGENGTDLIMMEVETSILEKGYSLKKLVSEMEFTKIEDSFALRIDMECYEDDYNTVGSPLFLGKKPSGDYCFTDCVNTLRCETLFSNEEVKKIIREMPKGFSDKMEIIKI